nr:TetR/AcrR family transcriptional regulator [Nocardioides litoris]
MTTRMSADDRRELVLDAATRAFARTGLHGTSTDAVAKEAGVSQPYVVRLFGTKLALFCEVLDRTTARIAAAFAEVVEQHPFDPAAPDDDPGWELLGLAYFDLLEDRDLLMVMMHGFTAGDIAEVAAGSRAGMERILHVLERTGGSDDKVRDFIAYGMLLNVMVSMRAPEHAGGGPDAGPLAAMACLAFGDKLDDIAAPRG